MMYIKGKKNTGSFYTCDSIADYIAKWAITDLKSCVLEPSFGDGIFIDAALRRFVELGNNDPKIIGIEMQEEPFNAYISTHGNIQGFQTDFMDYRAVSCSDSVIGNPPYVSLKNLNSADRNKVLALMASYGVRMKTCSSMWVPFIIHSTEILNKGGKLGFVLPYEITHVRYAFDLWKYLSRNYGKLTLCRIYHDFFPDVDVETVLLLAEDKGANTDCVHYNVYDTISDLHCENVKCSSVIDIIDIIGMNKPFERKMLSKTVITLLDRLHNEDKLIPMIQECKFKIGYVSGNKNYFHVAGETIEKFGIKPENVKKCLLNAKQITADSCAGIETRNIQTYSSLFYPTKIGDGEKEYIQYGESLGVNKGYKCRVRKTWYLTPGLEIPDVILTVFGDVPKLLSNNGDFYVSNSLLSGFSKKAKRDELICRWYNSLTLLLIEITIHSLGGGTLVLIPGETDKLEILSKFPANMVENIYFRFTEYAKSHKAEEIYILGDKIVLQDIYGFTSEEIDSIHLAIRELRGWRNPEKRRR